MPARVAAMHADTDSAPSWTHATRSPLETPLQWQIWVSAGRSAALAASAALPRSKSSLMRSSGSAERLSKAWVSAATLLTSPTSVAPISVPSRMTTVW